MLGIDVVKISRIEKMYQKFGIKAYEKFLRSEEIKLIKSPETVAGFWSIKEATSKALGCGIGEICGFKDIWIHKDEHGKPYITLSRHLVEKYKIKDISISISHDDDFAIGVVMIVGDEKEKVLCH